MSDVTILCVSGGKEGLGPGGFPISYYVVYRAVMPVGVGIYSSGDFAILCFVLLAIMCLILYVSYPQSL